MPLHIKKEGTNIAICGASGYRVQFITNNENVDCKKCKEILQNENKEMKKRLTFIHK